MRGGHDGSQMGGAMRSGLPVLVAVVVPLAVWAEAPAPSVFGPGEQTTYAVSYLGVPTGEAQITVGWKMLQFGREVWPLVCVGQTTSIAAAYPVKDRFVSYWDPVRRQAVGADFFVDEGRKRRRERYRYDEEQLTAFATKQHEGKGPVEVTYAIERGTLDLASAAFSLRNTPLVAGAVHEMPIFTGVKLYRMRATVEGKVTVETPLGALEAWRVTVNGDFDGKLSTKGLMTIYYSADERQVPVRAEAEFLLGSIVVEATRYEPGRTVAGGLR